MSLLIPQNDLNFKKNNLDIKHKEESLVLQRLRQASERAVKQITLNCKEIRTLLDLLELQQQMKPKPGPIPKVIQKIERGPNGGVYYINSSGKKQYWTKEKITKFQTGKYKPICVGSCESVKAIPPPKLASQLPWQCALPIQMQSFKF